MFDRTSRTGRTSLTVLSLVLTVATAAPAFAQSAASRIDQPTAATLPDGVSTVPGNGSSPGDRKSGEVAPPSAIQSSTDVMESTKSIQGRDSNNRVNPIEHLPKDMR